MTSMILALIYSEFCNLVLALYLTVNGLHYLRVGGRELCLGAEKKLEARKILENRTASQTSGVCCVGHILQGDF